jgi:thioesterase domain-containing protein
MATFVLVHGAWHGAWCWRRVARLLTRAGHEVFTPTLTGLAERSHLLTHAINLDTHIFDVVNEMKWQELSNVVLVGHSYGGMVISGVTEKMERAILSFVMLDAFMPENGVGRLTAATHAGYGVGGGAAGRDESAAAAR